MLSQELSVSKSSVQLLSIFHYWAKKKSIPFIHTFTSDSTGYPHCEKVAHCFNVPYSVLSIFSLIPFSNNKTEFTVILKCFNLKKNLMCMGKCLYIWAPCVCSPQRSQKRVWDPLELEWQKVLQEPYECWELTPGPLPERHMLISTLQSLRAF